MRGPRRFGRARLAGDHLQIGNPHQHLEVRSYDVEVRRPVIIGVYAHTHGAKALQGRLISLVQLLHLQRPFVKAGCCRL